MKQHATKIAAAGTVACALGVGFFMQHDRDVPVAQAPHTQAPQTQAPQTQAAIAPAAEPAPQTDLVVTADPVSTSDGAETLPEPQAEEIVALNDLSLVSSPLGPAKAPSTEAPSARSAAIPGTPTDPATPDLGCDIQAQASTAPGAIVTVDVNAKCYPNERVTLHHSGLVFTETTDHQGRLSVDIPALTRNAVILVAFANKKGAVLRAQVPDLAGLDRIALQWSGSDGPQIHAREYGAGYGQRGHVWAGNTRFQRGNPAPGQGYMVTLGNPDTFAPRMAEVYTFPTQGAEQPGTVALSIEAQVTESTCDRDLSAHMLRLSPDESLQMQDIALSMPNCTAVGDFLVLNNLVDDLKIAGNN